MHVDVANARELQDLGARAIDRARDDGLREVALRLAPGVYEGVPIALGSAGPALARLTLAAADPDDPPQLTDLSMHMHADHVRLEHLVVSATRRSLPVIAVEAGRVELRRCAVVGCRLDGPQGSRLVELRARAGTPHTSGTLEDCWFVDNHAPEYGTALVAAEGYARLDLVGTVFAANHAHVSLAPRARTVHLKRCMAVGERDGVFLSVTARDTAATIEECVLAWPSQGDLVVTANDGVVAHVRRSVLTSAPRVSAPLELETLRYIDPPGTPLTTTALQAAARRAAAPRIVELAAGLGLMVQEADLAADPA